MPRTLNPLERLTRTELRSAVAMYDHRTLTFVQAASDLLKEADDDVLDELTDREYSDLCGIAEAEGFTQRTTGDDLSALERSVCRLDFVRERVAFTLEELGRATPPYEQDVLNLDPAELQKAFDYYRAKAWGRRVALAYAIDADERAFGHPGLDEPLRWRAEGDLGELLERCGCFFTQKERHMSPGWVEDVVGLTVRLSDALASFGTGAN